MGMHGCGTTTTTNNNTQNHITMSWKETLTSNTEKLLTTVGVSKESTDYVRKQLGDLLDQVETKITGVPQVSFN
jgi:hypothetical protein